MMTIGPAGSFVAPKKPWDFTPPETNASNFMYLTDNEIEELTDEEILSIARELWKRIPTLNIYKLKEKIILKKNLIKV